MSTPVELRVGGQTYRVLASADESELRRLAGIVDARLRSITTPGRQVSSQALVLAAIALAHDLEEERGLRRRVEQRSQEMLRGLLTRIDAALEADDIAGAASGAAVASSVSAQHGATPSDAIESSAPDL